MDEQFELDIKTDLSFDIIKENNMVIEEEQN